MKTALVILFCLVSSITFAQGTAKKDTPKISSTERVDSVMISLANQADITTIQKMLTEINDPDYVKKQTAILNDRLMTIVNALLKSKFDPEQVVENSLKYEPGKLTVRLKK